MYTPDHSQDQALVRAATDRWRLARLVGLGKAKRRDGEFELRHPDVTKPFVAMITRLLPGSGINLAIRPNRKKAKKR